jgi:hypothetical protein
MEVKMVDGQAVSVATKAAMEVIKQSNIDYKNGICTYNEIKIAINNACYVAKKVCDAAGIDFDSERESLKL